MTTSAPTRKKQSASLNLAADYQLRFSDEFDGDTLDPDKWNTHFLWGPYLVINDEQQYYVDALGSDSDVGYTPFTLQDGILSTTARHVDAQTHNGFSPPVHIPSDEDAIWSTFPTFRQTGPYPQRNYTSGIITLYDSFKFAHGYIEMRARAPAGSGLLSVFGMLNGYYVAQQPEIDIMAVLGEKPNEVFHGYRRRMNNGLPAPQDSSTTSPGDASIAYSDDFYTYLRRPLASQHHRVVYRW